MKRVRKLLAAMAMASLYRKKNVMAFDERARKRQYRWYRRKTLSCSVFITEQDFF